nr:MAG TPA: hypothetical protein [Caudoviricetes sp.]
MRKPTLMLLLSPSFGGLPVRGDVLTTSFHGTV